MFTKVKNFIFILAVALVLVNTVNIILNGIDNAKEYTLTTMLQTVENGASQQYYNAHNGWATAFTNILHGNFLQAFTSIITETSIGRGIRVIASFFERTGQYVDIILTFINNFFALF